MLKIIKPAHEIPPKIEYWFGKCKKCNCEIEVDSLNDKEVKESVVNDNVPYGGYWTIHWVKCPECNKKISIERGER